MKGKNVTIFGLGAIGGFIGGNVFAFYKGYLTATITKTYAINRVLFWKIYCLELNLTLCLFLVQ